MSTLDTIMERRTIRKYQDKPIEREKLERILQAGHYAPSARNAQDWKFICVDKPDLIAQVATAMPQDFGEHAAAFIVGVGKKEAGLMMCGQPRNTVDLSIATTAMQLVAWEEGVGSCWIGSFDAEVIREVLSLPNEQAAITLTVLGYPDESPERRPRKAKNEVIQFNK